MSHLYLQQRQLFQKTGVLFWTRNIYVFPCANNTFIAPFIGGPTFATPPIFIAPLYKTMAALAVQAPVQGKGCDGGRVSEENKCFIPSCCIENIIMSSNQNKNGAAIFSNFQERQELRKKNDGAIFHRLSTAAHTAVLLLLLLLLLLFATTARNIFIDI